MLRRGVAARIVLAASLISFPIQRAALADTASSTLLVERGRYLATGAGQCLDCHGRALTGAPLRFPVPPTADFTKHAPRIAGLPHLTIAQAERFLETGSLPNGRHARHPMPAYRFDRDDAAALAAYLKSL